MYFNLTGLIQGNLCGIFLQTENCGLSDPEVLEWTVPPSSVQKPPVTEWTAPPVVVERFLSAQQSAIDLLIGRPDLRQRKYSTWPTSTGIPSTWKDRIRTVLILCAAVLLPASWSTLLTLPATGVITECAICRGEPSRKRSPLWRNSIP